MNKKNICYSLGMAFLLALSAPVYAEEYLTVIKLTNQPLCFDVRGGAFYNGNTVITYPCHIYRNQTFWYDDVTGVISPFGDKNYHATDNNGASDDRLKIYDSSRSDDQSFFIQIGGKIKGARSGKCWSLRRESSLVNQITSVDCSSAVETWVIQKLAFDGELVSLNHNLCLQAEDDRIVEGARIIVTNCVRKDSQKWKYAYEDGLMRMATSNNLCIGVRSAALIQEEAILKTCNASDVSQVINFADGVGAYLRRDIYSDYYDSLSSEVGSPLYLIHRSSFGYLSSAFRFNQPIQRIPKIEIR